MIFTQLTGIDALNAGNFAANASGAAQDANDYIFFNRTTGLLSYDADANGAGAAVAFASIVSLAAITAADFIVIRFPGDRRGRLLG